MADGCLREYLRKKVTNRKGVRQEVPAAILWACCEDDTILVGYAQLHTGLDVPDKLFGTNVAINRAYVLAERLANYEVLNNGKEWWLYETTTMKKRNIPYLVRKGLPGFLVRCEKYFKQGTLTSWAARVRAAVVA